MIAIDPGPEQSAYMAYSGGQVGAMGITDNRDLVERLRGAVRGNPDEPVVIEMVASYGMSVGKDVFETVYWIGRFSEAVGGAERVYRKDVKVHLCGNMKAKDSNIRQALIDRFGGTGGKDAAVGKKASPGPLYGIRKDLWSALAVAVTYEDRRNDRLEA